MFGVWRFIDPMIKSGDVGIQLTIHFSFEFFVLFWSEADSVKFTKG